jgi:hypothetical protein
LGWDMRGLLLLGSGMVMSRVRSRMDVIVESALSFYFVIDCPTWQTAGSRAPSTWQLVDCMMHHWPLTVT